MNGLGGKAVGDERKKDQVKGVANGPRSFPFLDISVGSVQFSSVQFSRSVMSNSLRPCGLQHTRLPSSITNFWTLLKLMSIEMVRISNHLILCRPLLLLSSIFPSIRVFSNESDLHIRLPKYWSFSFNNSPSSKYSGLISVRMDCLDLLAVQSSYSQSYGFSSSHVWMWELDHKEDWALKN